LPGACFCGDVAGAGTRFIFERAHAEIARAPAIRKVFLHEYFESAASLTLRDVNELMEKELAITPTISPDNDSISDGHAAGSVGDDLGGACGIG